MSTRKRALGRGLGDLGLKELLRDIHDPVTLAEEKISVENESENGSLRNLAVDLIIPGRYQPRQHMDQEALIELANSIRSQGIIQPIVVRKQNNHYEIIAGERRWRAAQIAELQSIPAIVRQVSDEAAIAMALIENIQRRDLNPIEEAIALQRLLDEFQMTHQEVADAVGKSRATITNLLRLQKLNANIKQLVIEGKLEMGHARALLTVEDFAQSELAKQIVAKNLSVREAENLIRRWQASSQTKKNSAKLDPDIMQLQNNLSEKLGAKILIQHTVKGKGKLVLHYNTLEELEGILEHIQ